MMIAGLLRCGKSCRLRWTNYLRPDIKRGNFSLQEEHTILELHNLLGNRSFILLLLFGCLVDRLKLKTFYSMNIMDGQVQT
ncbi:unnamed protein product [Linum tenue]|uniref:HTH myb-type domain-containing protein n=1 Tax=Linum tenue TaxID=586396 RepID=A0AAV0HLL0_9ROSI|nr:unnamed protein product [Linum tenue]